MIITVLKLGHETEGLAGIIVGNLLRGIVWRSRWISKLPLKMYPLKCTRRVFVEEYDFYKLAVFIGKLCRQLIPPFIGTQQHIY